MKRMLLVLALALGLPSWTAADESISTKVILNRALATARTIEDIKARASAIADVFGALTLAADKSAATHLKPEMIEIALKIANAPERDDLRKRLVAMQAGSWIEASANETLEGAEQFT